MTKATEEFRTNITARRAGGECVSGFRAVLGEDAAFPPEPDRYHLFVAFSCPWCHRVTLARNMLGLAGSITMDVAFPDRTGDDDSAAPNQWEFNPARIASLTGTPLPECTGETGTGKSLRLAKEIYDIEGSNEASLPILYDKRSKCIVTNESAEIVRMLNAQAGPLGSGLPDA